MMEKQKWTLNSAVIHMQSVASGTSDFIEKISIAVYHRNLGINLWQTYFNDDFHIAHFRLYQGYTIGIKTRKKENRYINLKDKADKILYNTYNRFIKIVCAIERGNYQTHRLRHCIYGGPSVTWVSGDDTWSHLEKFSIPTVIMLLKKRKKEISS